jgi:hypothetical protein
VLFSQEPVADFINRSFEPVWVSVRPVPIVCIDFGNGNILTRTLHGNILTSICTPDGYVVDALPGIYREAEYLSQLELLGAIAKNAQSYPDQKSRDILVRAYHRGQVKILKGKIRPEQVAAELARLAMSKNAIEVPLELVLLQASMRSTPRGMMPGITGPGTRMTGMGQPQQWQSIPAAASVAIAAEDVAHWKELEEDTRLNERARRLWIHSFLEKAGLVKPEKVTQPIYKEVLHADLDDPYLGLGEILFAKYPFAKEDGAHGYVSGDDEGAVSPSAPSRRDSAILKQLRN